MYAPYTHTSRIYAPYTQTTRMDLMCYTHPIHRHLVYTHPIHRQPAYAQENRVFCKSENFPVNPLCYLKRSPLQMYPQIFTRIFSQENRYTICTSVFLWVSFVSYLYLHVALHFPYFRASSFKIISFCKAL
jgi:hypothetical protein